MTPIDQILKRIDDVLKDNRRTETIYILMTVLLFGAGIGCLIQAVYMREFLWSVPPVATTALLHYPMTQIRDLRAKNIALATAPLLISTLPVDKAAEEMVRLLKSLHGETSE
ncbi:hypothetical protein [Mesorhizobium sp.]|uniref:hypothetical protein n=1 Tax=Mesorhizobium sp. TaxID=1871066 RepID=UPI000FE7FD5B|nr:hypothetical protein [Mesorhizobium sp.]RWQ28341.1 MAG: hypothetical protein EOS19_15555 [Mesorhizobium sp.]